MSVSLSDCFFDEDSGFCCDCGLCVTQCENLAAAGVTIGSLQKSLFEAFRNCDAVEDTASALQRWKIENEDFYRTLRTCFLCGRCTEGCPCGRDSLSFMLQARFALRNAGLIEPYAYSSVEVDRQWHIFTAYRAVHGVWYDDLIRHVDDRGCIVENSTDVAFFPGCSLMAYAPELTRAVFEHMESCAGRITLIDSCCGSPLKSAGVPERANAMLQNLVSQIALSGAEKVVFACPGCQNNMREAIEKSGLGLKVESLPEFLVSHPLPNSVSSSPPEDFSIRKASVFKPCQDHDASYVRAVRALLTEMGVDSVEANIEGACCGAGGAVSAFDPAYAAQHTSDVLDTAFDGVDAVVSVCPTCAYTFAAQKGSGTLLEGSTCMYLEILFGIPIEWEQVFSRLNGMWSGEYADWLASLF